MEEKVQNILETSMEDIVKDAITKVDIEGIFIKQINQVVERIASDMFSSYGPFKESLDTKLKEAIDININKISVPEFGNLAVSIIDAEFAKIERKEEQRLGQMITKRIAELTNTDSGTLKLLELQDIYYQVMFEEFVKYRMECSCDSDFNPDDRDDVINYMQSLSEHSSEYECSLTFIEKSMNWGSDWKACSTNLNMAFKRDDKIQYELIVKLDRVRQKDEKYNDDDYWRNSADNHYKITDVLINGKSINDGGSIYLNGLDYKLEEKFAAMFLNGALLDCNDLEEFEHESD